MWDVGHPAYLSTVQEAVALLAAESPGPDLVYALSWLSYAYNRVDMPTEAIETADNAVAVAVDLRLPAPRVAEDARLLSRCFLGDAAALQCLDRVVAERIMA